MTIKTPAQRALVQFIESMIITALIAGLFSISTLVTTDGPIDWGRVVYAFGLAVAFSVVHSLAAYFKPSNVELSTLIEATVQTLEKRYQTQPLQGPLVVVHPPPSAVQIQPIAQKLPAEFADTKILPAVQPSAAGLSETPMVRPSLSS